MADRVSYGYTAKGSRQKQRSELALDQGVSVPVKRQGSTLSWKEGKHDQRHRHEKLRARTKRVVRVSCEGMRSKAVRVHK